MCEWGNECVMGVGESGSGGVGEWGSGGASVAVGEISSEHESRRAVSEMGMIVHEQMA